MGLTHIDEQGRARMVDVSEKAVTAREATAGATIRLGPVAAAAIRGGTVKKGDVLQIATIAGVMGAKATSSLIPLCHPLPLSGVSLDFTWEGDTLHLTATARTTSQTGVEMEALTAVSTAALTVYDMVKAVERGVVIERIRLLHKAGGKSGEWRAED